MRCLGCGEEFSSRDGATRCYQCTAAARMTAEAAADADEEMVSLSAVLDGLNRNGTFTLPDGRRIGQIADGGVPRWGVWR